MHNDPFRQTGRTTRSISNAINAALEGKNVFYISHNSLETSRVSRVAKEILHRDYIYSGQIISNKQWQLELFIHKRGAGTIRFITSNQDTVCLETYPYCVRGCKEECFVDHYVWEQNGWRPSHQKRKEPSHPWSPEAYNRLWNALFPGCSFGSMQKSSQQTAKKVADKIVKKPYISTATLDMRDKFGGGMI